MNQTLTIVDVLFSLVFMNEFYILNGIDYRKHILNHQDTKYINYCDNIKLKSKYPSLLHLFGIHHDNPYTDFISFKKGVDYPISRNNDYFNQIIYLNNDLIVMKLSLIEKKDNFKFRKDINWISDNFKEIINTKVFKVKDNINEFIINLDLKYVRTSNSRSIWQKIFSRLVTDINCFKYPIYLLNNGTLNLNGLMDLEFCLYPIDRITKSTWKINYNLEEILSNCSLGKKLIDHYISDNDKVSKIKYINNILNQWLFKLDWMRKRDYIMTLYLLEKKLPISNLDTNVYFRFHQLDSNLQKLVLSYL